MVPGEETGRENGSNGRQGRRPSLWGVGRGWGGGGGGIMDRDRGTSGTEGAREVDREGAAGFGPARPGQGAALPAGAQQVPERFRGRTAGGLTCAPRAGPGGGRSAAGAASGRGFPRELSVPLPGGGRGRVL